MLDQEQARLEALRQRDQDRAKRFMNAKLRSIGIDTGSLDKQIEEKRRLELAQQEEKLAEAENLKQLIQCLDESEAKSTIHKRQSLHAIKMSLDEQRNQPKNNALGMDGPLDLTRCGSSSLQCFSGEDHMHGMRKKAQQEQVKFWCAEYMVEKNRAQEEERKNEVEYANYVLEQDRIRSQLEAESKQQKDEEARRLQLENLEHARQARQRKQQEMQADKEDQRQKSHYLTENTKLGSRRDHFKGFEKDEVKKIYKENDAVVEEKRSNIIRDAQTEAEWAAYSAYTLDKMKETEKEKQQMIAEENHIQSEILARQREEVHARHKKEREESKPPIDSEFFLRFGQSCR